MKIIDTDSHLTEPPDLWSSRLPKRWVDRGPRVVWHEPSGMERWLIGDRVTAPVGGTSGAGRYRLPGCPKTWAEVVPECYDPKHRSAWLDEHGITAQVLYSNVLAFDAHAFMALDDPALAIACVRAYNDHQTDFAAAAPGRFIPITNLPFWDVAATVAELERCAENGHRGLLWAATFEKHGLPVHTDPHWDPVYDAAQSLGLPVNFHVGVGKTEEEITISRAKGSAFDPAFNTQRSAMGWLSNANTIAGLVMTGVCDRFPDLKFVSVESGFGYLPYLIEALDWQWLGSSGREQYPDRLLPSEYFRRQIYTMFWFERSALSMLHQLPDNVMFETDFPHATSLTPGPESEARSPGVIAQQLVDELGSDLMDKVLYENAARLYHLN
jgi:predicted TIM-barrel fold metal-dependent hydrolase